MKHTRKALWVSAVTIFICFTLTLGSTLAWFSDSVENKGNKITTAEKTEPEKTPLWNAEVYDYDDNETSNTAIVSAGFIKNDPQKTKLSFANKSLGNFNEIKIMDDLNSEPGKSHAKLIRLLNGGDALELTLTIENVKSTFDNDALWFSLYAKDSKPEAVNIISSKLTADTFSQTLTFYLDEATTDKPTSTDIVLAYGMNTNAGSSQEEKTFECDFTITPKLQSNDIKPELTAWDGKSVNTDWFTDDKEVYNISGPDELAGLAKLVGEGNTFKNKTIKLDSDIDLANRNWSSIGNGEYSFEGILDAEIASGENNYDAENNKNHTIYNLTSPLFNVLGDNSEIKYLTISGARIIQDKNSENEYAGIIANSAQNGSMTGVIVEKSDIIFTSSSLNAKPSCGAILGHLSGTYSFDNCTVSEISINNGYSSFGGFIGDSKSETYSEINFSGCTANALKLCSDHIEYSGGFIGKASGNIKIAFDSCKADIAETVFTATDSADASSSGAYIGFIQSKSSVSFTGANSTSGIFSVIIGNDSDTEIIGGGTVNN